MKRLTSVLLISILSALIGFYFLSFFIPKTVTVESSLLGSVSQEANPSNKEEPFYFKDFGDVKSCLISLQNPDSLPCLELGDEFSLSKMGFVEVNLSDMKIRVYKDEVLQKEVPILAKGDPQGWGGTAAGLYRVIYKSKNSFSLVSEVYMPWAVHFYGKYYFHGEPYYPGGKKLISEISGGCLRLQDKDAESLFEQVERGMLVLVIDKENDNYEYSKKGSGEFPQVSAKSFLAADLDSGLVLAEKDSQKQLPLASITKLMTAIVVAENVDLERSILVRSYMLETYGSTEGLEEEKRYGVVELFYPLLIESSNDAAEVLSYFLGKEKTIRLMNEKAESILMGQTKFVDPSGFDPESVSTARDLFYLARYVFNNRPPILEITKGKEVRSFGEVSFDIEKLWNKNVFINDPTFVGGKTGYTIQARYTALFIFRFNAEDAKERNIVIILLGSENLETDTQKIYIWLQENYFQALNE